MPRLFVAIDPPKSLLPELSRLGRELAGARPTPPEQLHLTLRFVGEVDEPTAERLSTALGGIHAPGFELTPRGLGFFPNARRPRIAWVGFEASEPLRRLQAAVETAVRACGLEAEAERFHPHVTVARLKRPSPRAAQAWLEAHAGFATPPFEVGEFHLCSSDLRPKGAQHRRRASFPLTAS